MPWTYEYNQELKFFEMIFSDTITPNDLKEATSKGVELEKKEGINRFLVKITGTLKVSYLDIHQLPEKQYEEEGLDRRTHMAVIIPTSHEEKEFILFFETVCRNRGWIVRSFTDRQEAINWLTTPGS